MAKKKITALTATTTLADDDLIPVVINVATTPASRKITKANARKELFAEVTDPVLFRSADGINFDTAAGDDSDFDIITLDVTGTPKLWWDESENAIICTSALGLPASSATVGHLRIENQPVLHTFHGGTAVGRNLFVGIGAGNFTASNGGGSTSLASDNVGVGYGALAAATTTRLNVGVGSYALNDLTTGLYNTAVGFEALAMLVTGTSCTAVGAFALSKCTGNSNTAVGLEASAANTTGYFNTSVGAASQKKTTDGFMNVSVGYNSLFENLGGNRNTAIGVNAMEKNTTGYQNVAVGEAALQQNTTGQYNLGFGTAALYVNTDGWGNVALGTSSLFACTSGMYNTACGYTAGYGVTTGDYNTLIGFQAGNAITTGDNNIIIGKAAQASAVDASNEVNIGSVFYGVQSATLANKRVGFFDAVAGTAQAAHIANAAGGTEVATINAILTVLENLGFIAKS